MADTVSPASVSSPASDVPQTPAKRASRKDRSTDLKTPAKPQTPAKGKYSAGQVVFLSALCALQNLLDLKVSTTDQWSARADRIGEAAKRLESVDPKYNHTFPPAKGDKALSANGARCVAILLGYKVDPAKGDIVRLARSLKV